jgi:hypothetical protein
MSVRWRGAHADFCWAAQGPRPAAGGPLRVRTWATARPAGGGTSRGRGRGGARRAVGRRPRRAGAPGGRAGAGRGRVVGGGGGRQARRREVARLHCGPRSGRSSGPRARPPAGGSRRPPRTRAPHQRQRLLRVREQLEQARHRGGARAAVRRARGGARRRCRPARPAGAARVRAARRRARSGLWGSRCGRRGRRRGAGRPWDTPKIFVASSPPRRAGTRAAGRAESVRRNPLVTSKPQWPGAAGGPGTKAVGREEKKAGGAGPRRPLPPAHAATRPPRPRTIEPGSGPRSPRGRDLAGREGCKCRCWTSSRASTAWEATARMTGRRTVRGRAAAGRWRRGGAFCCAARAARPGRLERRPPPLSPSARLTRSTHRSVTQRAAPGRRPAAGTRPRPPPRPPAPSAPWRRSRACGSKVRARGWLGVVIA